MNHEDKKIYFLRPIGMEGPVKIGCSISPERRLRDLSLLAPFPLEIIATMKGGHSTEKRLHHFFIADRSHGEWFNWSDKMRGIVDEIQAGTFSFVGAEDHHKQAAPFKSRLRAWMEENNVTATAIAKDLGVSVSTVTRTACGSVPSKALLIAIVEHTGGDVKPNDFYGVEAA